MMIHCLASEDVRSLKKGPGSGVSKNDGYESEEQESNEHQSAGPKTAPKYRDYASCEGGDEKALNIGLNPAGAPGMVLHLFPSKLHSMVSNPAFDGIISWLPHGRSWKVWDVALLEQTVLPQYFDTGNYNSFMRLVNSWGFRRIRNKKKKSKPDYHSYYHDMFLRGQPDLLPLIKRRKKNEGKPKDDAAEPNFDELPPITIGGRTTPVKPPSFGHEEEEESEGDEVPFPRQSIPVNLPPPRERTPRFVSESFEMLPPSGVRSFTDALLALPLDQDIDIGRKRKRMDNQFDMLPLSAGPSFVRAQDGMDLSLVLSRIREDRLRRELALERRRVFEQELLLRQHLELKYGSLAALDS